MKSVKILAAKITVFSLLVMYPVSSFSLGMPVIDGFNLSQNILSAIEEIAQTIQQIQEYKIQLEQYERQAMNSLDFDEFIWDESNTTISDMLGEINGIASMANTVRGANDYLSLMQDGLTASEIDAIYTVASGVTDTENQSIDELIATVENQQISIQSDADKLIELQVKAEQGGKVGQIQALQTANMLSSHMSNQLLQLRAVVQAQANADAALKMKQNNKDAWLNASMKAAREGVFVPSSPQSF